MNPQPPPDDLTADWPADPDNEALARFAAQLQGSLPEMAPASLEKVRRAMWGPVRARSLPGRITPGRLAIAAGILLTVGIGGYFVFRPAGPFEQSALVQNAPPHQETPVEDVFDVELAGPGAPAAPEKPLLRIEDYQALFTD